MTRPAKSMRRISLSIDVNETVDVDINLADILDELDDDDIAATANARGYILTVCPGAEAGPARIKAITEQDELLKERLQYDIRASDMESALLHLEWLYPPARGIADLARRKCH